MGKLITLLISILTIVGLVRFSLIPLPIENSALSPTLTPGDQILVDRATNLLDYATRLTGAPELLKRGDIVAIIPPDRETGDWLSLIEPDKKSLCLRRVIGLPGEKIALRKGFGIMIDGRLLDERTYSADPPAVSIEKNEDLAEASRMLPELLDDGLGVRVPEGMLFLLADRRSSRSSSSSDSDSESDSYPAPDSNSDSNSISASGPSPDPAASNPSPDIEGSERWGFVDRNRVIGIARYLFRDNQLSAIPNSEPSLIADKIALNDQGVRALDEGRYLEAIHNFEAALSVDQDYLRARENLAIAYNNLAIDKKEESELSLQLIHKSLYLDPNNEMTRENLDKMIILQGKEPNNFEHRIEIAEGMLAAREPVSALVEYREALRLRPSPEIVSRVFDLEKVVPRDPVRLEESTFAPGQMLALSHKDAPLRADEPETVITAPTSNNESGNNSGITKHSNSPESNQQPLWTKINQWLNKPKSQENIDAKTKHPTPQDNKSPANNSIAGSDKLTESKKLAGSEKHTESDKLTEKNENSSTNSNQENIRPDTADFQLETLMNIGKKKQIDETPRDHP